MKRWRLVLTAAILAALAVHVAVVYLPRERPAAIRAETLVARLFASPEMTYAVWVPYPHQNLAQLELALGGDPGAGPALLRLAGLPELRPPAFGPLRVPPARELVVAADATGERFVLAARVYPTMGLFARLAGRLAGNPWLAGGEVRVEGRPATVSWHGGVWTVSAGAVVSPPSAGRDESASLALVRLGRARPPLPDGLFALRRQGDGFELTSPTPVADELRLATADLAEHAVYLAALDGGGGARALPAQAMAFFVHDPGQPDDWPRVASICDVGGRRWKIPGEGFLEMAVGEKRVTVGAWSVAAYDRHSLAAAGRLAPRLMPLTAPRAAGRLRWALWLDLAGFVGEVSRIGRTLERNPIVSPRRRQMWRDAETVLRPLEDRFSHLELVVQEGPTALRLRLETISEAGATTVH